MPVIGNINGLAIMPGSRLVDVDKLEAELKQLNTWVDRIYYANIAMNNEAIKSVIDEIAKAYHIEEMQDIAGP